MSIPGPFARRFARVILCAALLVAAGVLAGASALAAADWNQWRGPGRDGVSRESPPLIEALPEDGLRPVWISGEPVPGGRNGGWSSPVVAGGRVYVFAHTHAPRPGLELPPEEFPPLQDEQKAGMTPEELDAYKADRRREQRERKHRLHEYREALYCFDGATGELRWMDERDSIATDFPQSSTPAVHEGRLYVVGADHGLRCLDALQGHELWSLPLSEPGGKQVPSSVAVAGGVAVVLAEHLVGVDAATGVLLWEGDPATLSGRYGSPFVWKYGGHELVLAHVNKEETVCIEPRTGRELWRVESHAVHSTPVAAGNRLVTYGHSRAAGLRCFRISPERAELVWTFPQVSDPGSSPVILDGHVYVQGECRLACLELKEGAVRWTAKLDRSKPRYTSLVAADGKLFYAFGGLLCFAADPSGWRPLYDGRMDASGLLAPAEHFRRILRITQLEQTEEGRERAEGLWQETIADHGPLDCASPALAGGRLYVRLRSGLACFDLRK